MTKKINVGLIGYAFMGKAHSHAYYDVTRFFNCKAIPVMKAICGRSRGKVKKAAQNWGWESYETDWHELIKRKDIDLIDISTPNDLHEDIAIAAAKAGKHIFCEKPMAMNLTEAKSMLNAAQKANIKHMLCFNYRRVPAIGLMKQLIKEGKIGKIYHIRSVYLQDWLIDPKFPLVWRLDKTRCGSGALGDLGAHIIDLARYLVGEFSHVVGMTETFIKERPMLKGKGKGKVTVDDAALFLAKFANGALGSFEATRLAAGRKNGQRIEINGSKGSLVFELERMNELKYYSRQDKDYERGFKTILVTERNHPYINAWWPAGHIIGYEHTFVNTVYDLMNCIAENKMPSPSFVDGVKCQAVLEAVEKSAKMKKWVKV
ncbi:MAG: Gfo/Idh/MocA family oxidoreductase [Spirochaetes bacterium]|nr:Gfo/Idh/MocA family oxidoreductase [Spirochaetota bacterium]